MGGCLTPFWEPIPHIDRIREFLVGVDLGKSQDYSAVSILERTRVQLLVRHLERLPLDMSYPYQVEYIYRIMNREPLDKSRQTLVVDYTGVGRPVVDMIRRKVPDAVAISIHGGNASTWSRDGRNARVPKRDLINCLQVLAQDCKLKVAKKMQFGPVLTQELQSFKVKISERTAHDSYSAREGEHDDLVLAVAIAAWTAENHPRPRAFARLVSYGGDVEDYGRDS